MYFLFGTKFAWNEEIDTFFNVECVLLGRDFDFLAGYLVITARYLVVTTGYCSLPLVTAFFPLLVWMLLTLFPQKWMLHPFINDLREVIIDSINYIFWLLQDT